MPINVLSGSVNVHLNENTARHLERVNVVDAGILCFLDASIYNVVTWGSTWHDVSGMGNNGSVSVSSPTFHPEEGGYIRFDGVDDQIDISGTDLQSTDHTVFLVSRTRGNGRTLAGTNNNWLLGSHSDDTKQYYAVGWVDQTANNDAPHDWIVHAATGSQTDDWWQLYINGSLQTENAQGSAGPNGLTIGCHGSGSPASQHCDCDVSTVLVYDRVLNSVEIAHVSNVLKHRVGVS